MHTTVTRLGTWKEKLDVDNRQWGLTRRTALGMALAPVVLVGIVAVMAVLAVVAKDTFRPLFTLVTAEDSLLEWPQFFFVLASSPIFACTGVLLMSRGQRAMGLLYLLIAVGAFLVAGEEISWGQRVFGWGTPESLAAINHQAETNVHNIRPVQRAFGYVVLLGGMYGFLTPLLQKWIRPRLPQSSLDFLIIPPLCVAPAFLMPFAYRLFRLVVWSDTNFVVVKSGEAPELCLYFGMLVFAWLGLRRLRQGAPSVLTSVSAARSSIFTGK